MYQRQENTDEEKASYTHCVHFIFFVLVQLQHSYTSNIIRQVCIPNFRGTEIKKFSCKVQFDFCILKLERKRNGALQNRLLLRGFLQPTIQKCKSILKSEFAELGLFSSS